MRGLIKLLVTSLLFFALPVTAYQFEGLSPKITTDGVFGLDKLAIAEQPGPDTAYQFEGLSPKATDGVFGLDKLIIVEQPRLDTAQLLILRAKEENLARVNMRRAELTDTECLSLALYHEARGEGVNGMRAVAFVIHNRVKDERFPKDYCGVILQPAQFSFITDRNPDNIRSWDVYEQAVKLSVELLENEGFDKQHSPVGNALFFNSLARPHDWVYSKGRKFIATIGNHHFFK